VASCLLPGYSYIYPKECPLDFNCFHDFESALAYARQEKKPLLVDFTGYGCVNCRRMEDNVWDKEGVYDLIKKNYVLVSLYVDDRKELEQPYTSALSGRTVKTVGKKWTELQIAHFNRNSQPYYVLLDNNLKVLNEPRGYTPDIIEYKDFLQCGYDRFRKDNKNYLVPDKSGLCFNAIAFPDCFFYSLLYLLVNHCRPVRLRD
jgi:thioredoxin-related protein